MGTHSLLLYIIAYVNREKLNPSQHLMLRYENQYGTLRQQICQCESVADPGFSKGGFTEMTAYL